MIEKLRKLKGRHFAYAGLAFVVALLQFAGLVDFAGVVSNLLAYFVSPPVAP